LVPFFLLILPLVRLSVSGFLSTIRAIAIRILAGLQLLRRERLTATGAYRYTPVGDNEGSLNSQRAIEIAYTEIDRPIVIPPSELWPHTA
jgi:hypothetical protein